METKKEKLMKKIFIVIGVAIVLLLAKCSAEVEARAVATCTNTGDLATCEASVYGK